MACGKACFECRNLVLTLLLSAWTIAPAGAQEKVAKGGPDLSYVTTDAVAVVFAHPSRVLKAPEMEMLPHEIFAAAGKKELGFDPADVDEILVVAEVAGGPPLVGVVIRLSKPHALESMLPEVAAGTTAGDLDGKPFLQAASPMEPSLYMPDDRTLLVGMAPMIEKMVAHAKDPQPGELSTLIGKTRAAGDVTAVAVIEPIREMLGAMLMMVPVPPPLEDLKQLPDLVKAAKIELTWTGTPQASVIVLAPDEAKAEKLETIVNEALDFGQEMALAELSQKMGEGDDPVEQATAQYMVRLNKYLFDLVRPKRHGTVLSITQDGAESMQVATTGVLVALLLPAVQAAREAARRSMGSNNLKQIGLAMHNHHDVYKELPAQAIRDDSGKPLLSWRVKILPFVEQNALYEQFHLDEPWDSPHNKELLAQMPAVYARPGNDPTTGLTPYLAPVGEGTLWNGEKGAKFRDVRDGLSNTIMVVEAEDEAAVPWTKPADWEIDANDLLKGVRNSRPGGFQALFCDGSSRFIANMIDLETLKAFLTMAGGETVGAF